jgi:hypothetical protein
MTKTLRTNSCLLGLIGTPTQSEKTMSDLTEEEYDALDEKWTKTTPKTGPNGAGFFARQKIAADAHSARSMSLRRASPAVS